MKSYLLQESVCVSVAVTHSTDASSFIRKIVLYQKSSELSITSQLCKEKAVQNPEPFSNRSENAYQLKYVS